MLHDLLITRDASKVRQKLHRINNKNCWFIIRIEPNIFETLIALMSLRVLQHFPRRRYVTLCYKIMIALL